MRYTSNGIFFNKGRTFRAQKTSIVNQLHTYVNYTNLLSWYIARFSPGYTYVLYLISEQMNSKITVLFLYVGGSKSSQTGPVD